MKAVKVRGALEPVLGGCLITVGRSAVLDAVAVPVHLQGCRHGSKAVEESSDPAVLELLEAIRRLYRQDRLVISHEAKRRNEQDRKSHPHHRTGSPDRGRSGMRSRGEPRPSPA